MNCPRCNHNYPLLTLGNMYSLQPFPESCTHPPVKRAYKCRNVMCGFKWTVSTGRVKNADSRV